MTDVLSLRRLQLHINPSQAEPSFVLIKGAGLGDEHGTEELVRSHRRTAAQLGLQLARLIERQVGLVSSASLLRRSWIWPCEP